MAPQILVVDDDRDFLEIMKRRLKDLHFRHVHLEEDPFKAASLHRNQASRLIWLCWT